MTSSGGPPGNGRATRAPTLLERAGALAAGVGRDRARRPGLRRALRWGVVALVVCFLAIFVATQWDRLPDFDWRFRPGWLAAAAALAAVYYAIHAEAWRAIVAGLGGSIDRVAGRAVWGKSLLARYVPTNALMVVSRVAMAEQHGIGRRVCVASVVYELGLALCGAVLLGAYFVITFPALAGNPVRFAVLAVVPIVLVGLHPRVFGPLAGFVLGKLGRDPLPATLRPRRVLLLLGAYVVSWIVIGSGVFAFASALHPADPADFAQIAAAQSIAFGVAVATPITPSGLGTRDAALAAALAVALPVVVAAAVAVGFRILQTAVELAFVGAVSLRAKASARRGALERPRYGTGGGAGGGGGSGGGAAGSTGSE